MPKRKKIPMRVCLGCQEKKPKKEMIRIVRTPEGNIEIDFTGKRSGRGTYICPRVSCFREAVKGKRLEKSLHHPVPMEVIDQLASNLEEKNE